MNPFTRVFWRPRVIDEVDEELAFHREMRTRELIAAGMEPDAARREAARRSGNSDRTTAMLHALGTERNQHMERTQYFGELRQDIAFTARQLVKNPGFTAVAVLTLALGIGATTAIFSAVYAVVLQPLPLADPSRLMLVGEIYDGAPQVMSVGNYVDTNAAVPDFDHGLSALNYANFNLADETTPERVVGARVTANYFDVMGVRPAIGRTFSADEDRPGNANVVVLSPRLWQRRFGGSAAVIGRPLRMNGVTHQIAGVMPESFDLTTDSEELWTPIAFTDQQKVSVVMFRVGHCRRRAEDYNTRHRPPS